MQFASESQLANAVLGNIEFWDFQGFNSSALSYTQELNGLWGIPDLIIYQHGGLTISDQIIKITGIEFKLRDWRTALYQAFKYKGYCDRSYVLIDHHFIRAPLANLNLFAQYNVGLLSLSNDGVFFVHHKSFPAKPYSSGLRKVALQKFDTNLKKRHIGGEFPLNSYPNGIVIFE